PRDRLRVAEGRRDAVLAGELPGALFPPARHRDLVDAPPARADQARDQRLAHLASAEEGHSPSAHRPLLARFDRKNQRFAGRSASRRVRYGYHSVPYGM